MYGARPLPAIHREGLPIADGADVTIDMPEKRFMIRTPGGECWDLPKERVTGMVDMTEDEARTVMKHSPGLALLGGAVMGVVGAVAGAAVTKEKKSKAQRYYFALDYLSAAGEPSTLVFEYKRAYSGNLDWQKPRQFMKDFKKHRERYAPPGYHVL